MWLKAGGLQNSVLEGSWKHDQAFHNDVLHLNCMQFVQVYQKFCIATPTCVRVSFPSFCLNWSIDEPRSTIKEIESPFWAGETIVDHIGENLFWLLNPKQWVYHIFIIKWAKSSIQWDLQGELKVESNREGVHARDTSKTK